MLTFQVGLIIKPVKPEDQGDYVCTLTNDAGSSEMPVKLTVNKLYDAPVFVQSFTDTTQVNRHNFLQVEKKAEKDFKNS